ncbi:MAG: hypothetical protein WC092_08665 [Anaerovoracaceae bacterium]
MSHNETVSSVSTRIRYYIYGLIRKNGDRSVPVPSSYKLAQEFDTTRSIVRYELEKLIASGALISRHRVGTFTNPLDNYAQHVLLDDHMQLVGVMYGTGDLFTYAAMAAKTLSAVFSELADANCYIHDLRLSPQSEEIDLSDVAAFEMDGFLWAGFRELPDYAPEFTARLTGLPCPVVTVGGLHPEVSGVTVDSDAAARQLADKFREEGRKRLLSVTLAAKHDEFLNIFTDVAENGTEIRAIRGDTVREVFAETQNFFERGETPDAILCDGAFAKAVSSLLREKRIDATEECCNTALSDFNGESDFCGIVVHTPFEELARSAVELLKNQMTTGKRTVEHRRIPLQLKCRSS